MEQKIIVLQEYELAIERFIGIDEPIFVDDKTEAVIIANEIRKKKGVVTIKKMDMKKTIYSDFYVLYPAFKTKWWLKNREDA